MDSSIVNTSLTVPSLPGLPVGNQNMYYSRLHWQICFGITTKI